MIKALLVLAAATSPTQSFNLVCSGTTESRSITGNRTNPYEHIYRIDLKQKKYCDGECKGLRPITDIQPARITLQDKQVDTFSEKSSHTESIDRVTGQHHILYTYRNPRDRLSIHLMEWKGQCVRHPFSGFPTFETKF